MSTNEAAQAPVPEVKTPTSKVRTLPLLVALAVALACFAVAIWLFSLPTEHIWTDREGSVETITETEALPNYALGGWILLSVGAAMLAALLVTWTVRSRSGRTAKARK